MKFGVKDAKNNKTKNERIQMSAYKKATLAAMVITLMTTAIIWADVNTAVQNITDVNKTIEPKKHQKSEKTAKIQQENERLKTENTVAEKAIKAYEKSVYDLRGSLGIIVGALISLASVLITLRWNQKLHESNLREERLKIKEEREFSAKQSALLIACESVTRFINYYISLPDRILPTDGTFAEEFTAISIAINRLHFYCSLETIEKSSDLMQVLNDAFTDVMKVKMASMFINEDLKLIDLQIVGFEKMNTNIQEEIKAIFQSEPQSSLIVPHREQLAKNYQMITDLYGKKPAIIKQKFIETEKCRDVMSQNLKSIFGALLDLLLLARQELSFSIDQAKYKTIMIKGIDSNIRKAGEFLTEIRKEAFAKMQESDSEFGQE